jgi:pilus assembly protein CpaC
MKKTPIIISLIVTGLLILPNKYYASADIEGEDLSLYMGEVKIISVNNPSRIVIGNPNIIDVTNVSKQEVTVIPKSPGVTSLIIVDNFGEVSYKARVSSEDLNIVKDRIDSLLRQLNFPGVYTKVEENEDKIILLGRVKTAADKERLTTALGSLKDKTTDLIQVREEEAVVEIDVQVLEVDKDATKNLGMSWPGALNFLEMGSGAVSAEGSKESRLFKILNWKRTALSWSIDALIEEGKARILSRPRLACQSGKEAELLVGGEKPVLTTEIIAGTDQRGTASVSYKDYGIKLKIKPIVMENRRIKIVLNVEVSEIGEAIVIGSLEQPTAKAWPLTKRNVSTELILDDKQTFAIGGLIKRIEEEDIRRTAFLSDIPIIGALFRKKLSKAGGGEGERGDQELFITLTPTIVSGGDEVRSSQSARVSEPERISEAPRPAYYQTTEEQSIKNPSSGLEITDLPQELIGYSHVIQKRILEKVTYPASARESGFQGTIKLSLHLSYKGDLLDIKVKNSSGYKVIDDNAITVVQGISSYPPFPPSIDSKDLWIDIPIEYQLN